MTRYGYRPIHALTERAAAWLASLAPRSTPVAIGEVPRKILAIKFGGLGDGAIVRSLLECFRGRHPGTAVDVLVDQKTREVMSCASDAKVWFYNPKSDGLGRSIKLLQAVRRVGYGAAVDFEQHSILTAGFAWAAGIPIRIGLAPPGENSRLNLLTHPVKFREGDSMWSAMAALLRVLDPELSGTAGAKPIPHGQEAAEWGRKWLEARSAGKQSRLVAIHLGVGPRARYRQWPLARFVELAEIMRRKDSNLRVLLTGAPNEQPLANEFAARYRGDSFDATTVGSVERTGALLSRCDLLICADTGVMHLGAALGVPTVGLFGPNTPRCWGPVGPRATYVHKTRLKCSPCIDSYRRIIPDACAAEEWGRCMLDIAVDDVINAARRVIVGNWLD